MARYIDADRLQDFLVETNDIDDWCISQYSADWISSFIESQPTANVVEVKHGKWEKRTFIIFDSERVGYRCSECNTTWDTNTNYCPNCGAKMDEEGDTL